MLHVSKFGMETYCWNVDVDESATMLILLTKLCA